VEGIFAAKNVTPTTSGSPVGGATNWVTIGKH